MYALEYEGIQSRFSRSNRASTQRVKDLVIQAPSIIEQKKIVSELDEYDNKIKVLNKNIKELTDKINIKFEESKFRK